MTRMVRDTRAMTAGSTAMVPVRPIGLALTGGEADIKDRERMASELAAEIDRLRQGQNKAA